MTHIKSLHFRQPLTLLITLALLALVTLFVPAERTLGASLRLIIFHGAWVWAGIVSFALAALLGLAGLLRKSPWAGWSLAAGRTGLFFWLTYLPMSLLVMQISWGGFFFDEPRWRIPFTFAVVGVLLQVGLWLFNSPTAACAGNLLFGAALLWSLSRADSVLHPESPVFQPGAGAIQVFFVLLVLLSLFFGLQLAVWLKNHSGTH